METSGRSDKILNKELLLNKKQLPKEGNCTIKKKH